MYTGGFNHALTIERKVQVGTSTLGDPIYVWQTFVEPLAEVTVRRGREIFSEALQQRFSEDVWQFRCHYHDVIGITAKMRVVDEDGQYFDIKSIRPDAEDRQDCIIECTLQDSTLGAAALMGFIDEAIADGTVGTAYAGFTVKATGGTSPYTFAVTSGTLPAGLSLNASTGAISGTPTTAGTSSSIVITVTDADDDTHALPAISIVIS